MLILDHIVNLLTGIFAGTGFISALYVFGSAILPRTFQRSASPSLIALYGAASVCLVSWLGISLSIPITLIFAALLFISGLLILFNNPFLLHLKMNPCLIGKSTFQYFLLFAFFYTVTYFFVLPPVGSDVLPIVNISNTDLFHYMNHASYLQRLGPSQVMGFEFIHSDSFIYDFTPAVFYCLAGMANFYHGEVIAAMMPTLFTVVALIGCAWVSLTRDAFQLPSSIAIAIATVLISGSFFRYIVHFYFLSTLVAMVLLLALLYTTLCTKKATLLSDLPVHFLLFYTYPPLFIIAIPLQCGIIAVQDKNSCALVHKAGLVFLSMLLVFLVDPLHTYQTVEFLTRIVPPGVMGWPLDLISPLAILGLPGPMLIKDPVLGLRLYQGLMLIMLLSVIYQRKIAVNLLYVFVCMAYLLYLYQIGISYQQWKLASYLLLPLSFIPWGYVAQACMHKPILNHGLICACMVLMVTSVLTQGEHTQARPTYDARVAQLRELELMGRHTPIDIEMANFTHNHLAVYFIRNQPLRFITAGSYPIKITPKTSPLFVENETCEQGGQPLATGCLYSTLHP